MSNVKRTQAVTTVLLVFLAVAIIGYLSLLARSTRHDLARMEHLDSQMSQSSQLNTFLDKVESDRRLLNAIKGDDAALVEAFFKQGTTIHTVLARQSIPVLAADNGAYHVMKLLLDSGVEPNAADHQGRTLLMRAANRLQPELVELLLSRGSNANAVDDRGKTALMYIGDNSNSEQIALGTGRAGMASLMAGFPDRPHPSPGNTARRIVSLLVAHGANLNLVDKRGMSAMKAAAYAGQFSLVQVLLDNGANPNDALVGAVGYGNEDLLTKLFDRGADANIPVKREHSLLHYARKLKRPQIVAILVKAGAKE